MSMNVTDDVKPTKIVSMLPLADGWVLGIILRRPIESINVDDYVIGRLPVIALGLDDQGEIEPIVAMQDGRILPSSRIGYDVLCLAGPDEDLDKVAAAALAVTDAESVEKFEQEHAAA